MIKQLHLLLITFFIALIVIEKVNAYSNYDEDDDEDEDDDYEYEDEDDYCEYDDEYFHHRKQPIMMTTTVTTTTTTRNKGDGGDISPFDFDGGPTPDESTCPNQGIVNEIFRRFNAIFFGDFYTFGGTDILGPLAVKGTLIAPNYVVNANHGVDCSAKGSVKSYGLVVGGQAMTSNTQVHGSAFVKGGGDTSGIKELENDCYVTTKEGTGVFDFVEVEKAAVKLNRDYFNHAPTLQLQADATVKRLAPVDNGIEYLTFNSCSDKASCENIWKDAMSVPDNVLFGMGNWNGIQGNKPDPAVTYVFNIPVLEDTTITINTNEPTQGFNACKVVLNFYAVKKGAGLYSPTGDFTIIRNTAAQLAGLTLAPRGNIRDGPIGNFAGTIIALSYTWAFTNGVEIHDYHAAGADCDYFDGCVPQPPSNCTAKTITATITQKTTTTTTGVASTVTSTEKTTTTTTGEASTVTDNNTVTATVYAIGTVTDSVTETTTDYNTETVTDSFTETTTDYNTETVRETETETERLTGGGYVIFDTITEHDTFTEHDTTTFTRAITTVTELKDLFTTTTVTVSVPTTTYVDTSTATTTATTTSLTRYTYTDYETVTDCVTSKTHSNSANPSHHTHNHHPHTHDGDCDHEDEDDEEWEYEKKKDKYKKYEKHEDDDDCDEEEED